MLNCFSGHNLDNFSDLARFLVRRRLLASTQVPRKGKKRLNVLRENYLTHIGSQDVIAIAIETGIQNTGVAILLLRFSLPQPDADLTLGEILFWE